MFRSGLLWSLAVLGTASAGLFLGSNDSAYSDISKFNAILAEHDRVPGEVIVRVKPGQLQAASSLAGVFASQGFAIAAIKPFPTNHDFMTVKLAGDEQTAAFLQAAAENPSVQYAEPNYILRAGLANANEEQPAPAERVPEVADFEKLWAMKNVGQKDPKGLVGKAGADISATKAWAITTGNRDITVAVIDTGVDYNHPALKDNIFINRGEIAGNGIDDDGNGFVDDVNGWNFSGGASTNNPMDDNEHGTHCSGTIGANGDKITGVSWNVSILPIKFLTASGSGSLADAVKSIQYATLMNVKMTSNSWGGGGFSQAMFDAIQEAKNKGILFIAAAGNDSQNSDTRPHYPAGYQLENVIAVASTTNSDSMSSFSTYGKRTVHIAAPGHNIYSSVPGGKYDTFSGTSMATPHVAGAAALVWGTDPSMTFTQVKERILNSRDYLPAISRKVVVGGRLNVYNAVMGIYPPSPEPLESDWKDVEMASPIESAHPYENNFKQEWTVDGPENAKFMRVVLEKVELEDGYDFLKVFDAAGAEVDSVSGRSENTPTFYVNGSKLMLRFTTDSSQTRWGFKVAKVQAVF